MQAEQLLLFFGELAQRGLSSFRHSLVQIPEAFRGEVVAEVRLAQVVDRDADGVREKDVDHEDERGGNDAVDDMSDELKLDIVGPLK